MIVRKAAMRPTEDGACSLYDCHSHILPGLDDGAHNAEATRRLLELEYAQGVRTVIATSHFRQSVWPYSLADYEKAFAQAEQIAAEIDPALRLIPGCELYCEEGFMYSILSDACPALPNKNVLVEFPYEIEAEKMSEYLRILQINGRTPIIAHAERYKCFVKNKKLVLRLREQGCLIQINTDSITGRNGFFARRFAKWMLNHEAIDLLGTDCHNVRMRPPRFQQCAEYIRQHCSTKYAQKLLYENPKQLFDFIDK